MLSPTHFTYMYVDLKSILSQIITIEVQDGEGYWIIKNKNNVDVLVQNLREVGVNRLID